MFTPGSSRKCDAKGTDRIDAAGASITPCATSSMQPLPKPAPAGAAGSPAMAWGDKIYVSDAFFALSRAGQELVLAHERAHLAQKRLGACGLPEEMLRTPAYRQALEMEAGLAAAHAVNGLPYTTALPDIADAVSHWGPAGHYWTTLFVMLAAGMDSTTALRRAFFCQMPDQVLEFDAIAAAVDYVQLADPKLNPMLHAPGLYSKPATPYDQRSDTQIELAPPISMNIPGTPFNYNIFPGLRFTLPLESGASVARRRLIDRQISSGLHCLTGRRGSDEIAFRLGNLKKYLHDEIKFGIGLHCFGDSYSHQNSKAMMFPPIVGHGLAGHAPDDMKEHKSQYLSYVTSLFLFIKSSFGTTEKFPLTNIIKALDRMASASFAGDDEAKNAQQSALLASVIKKLGLCSAGAVDAYSPQGEAASYWRSFHPRHTSRLMPEGQAQVFQIVRQLGAEWNTI